MRNAESLTAEQISEFWKASGGIEFTGQSRAEIYTWTERMLMQQEYSGQSRKQRGAIRAYLSKVTGRSLAQITRLVRAYVQTGRVEPKPFRRRRFPRKYRQSDIVLLTEVDRAHERLSGPATQCILKREHQEFGKKDFVRLAGISVSHLYNLRGSLLYRKHAAIFESTRPSPVSIGERRKPDPQGQPGFLRVDTVHQGDWRRCCISFRSGFWAFTPTTARSSSTTRWLSCWKSCGWSSPRAALTVPPTTRWWRARTAR